MDSNPAPDVALIGIIVSIVVSCSAAVRERSYHQSMGFGYFLYSDTEPESTLDSLFVGD